MSQPVRILLAGGGTGGHIYPLLSLADHWRTTGAAVEVRFVGERGRMEADLVPRAGYPLELLDLPPANAPKWRKALALGGWLRGWRQAQALLRSFEPHVVVGAGGQVCAPTLIAASRAGRTTVVLEPNAVPGRANRWLARRARPALVAILMPAAASYFPGSTVEQVGYPIRPAILAAAREASLAALGLDPTRRTLLVFGGSLGSGRINEALVGLLPQLTADWARAWQVLHIGGRVNAKTLGAVEASNLVVPYHYRDYLHAMEQALAAADLVVGRAGAMSLAELTARGLPAVLSPFPGAADDHQRYNAAWMADAGAAVVIEDAALTPARLGAVLTELLSAPDRVTAMAAASRGLGRPEATRVLADRIAALAQETSIT